MTFKKNFCPSPWFHMRINNSGTYEYCRWMVKDESSSINNIKNQTPLDYFQNTLSKLRTEFLEGQAPAGCANCYIMEANNKVSGRQRQLLKVGVQTQTFEKSLAGSPIRDSLDYSNQNQGHTTRTVSDWQIDLGNYCNGACVFCNPAYSSKLATEFKQLGIIDQVPASSWCDNPELLSQFINDLTNSPDLRYLHFIGGETLITPGFKKILQALIDADIAKNITIGFTTNLTVWSESIVKLLTQFQQINLGMSVETLTSVNDYVRYPSQQHLTRELLDRWVALGRQQNWLMQLRITPTCLTVHDLDTVYEYAWQNSIAVESCNFIDRPKFMRIGVLPQAQREQSYKNLNAWIETHSIEECSQIVNTRDPNRARQQIVQDARSYLNYLKSAEDESQRLPDLVQYLKRLESSRGNSILTYLPHYEDLFRSAGY